MNENSQARWSEARRVARQRVDLLCAAGLLGASAEERFDRLTRLAQRLLRAPVALITLLDMERQFFLSAQGLAEPWSSLRETPLSHSFCRSVVETGAPLLVEDARHDPQLRDNPAIEALGVVAYLAVPLALPGGCVVGALCTIDAVPRAWSQEDEQALTDLAGAVVAEMSAWWQLRELEAAGEALRVSEARYRALIEVSPQMVWIADAQGANTYVNRECAEFIGSAVEELLSDGWAAALHSDDRGRVLADWADAVRSGRAYEVECRLRRGSDGSYRWILARGRPLRDQAGRIEGWIGVGVDIDDRRRTVSALRDLIEALGVAVYTTDADGHLTFYNEAAVHLWGWRPRLDDSKWCGSWRLYWPDGRAIPHEDCPMSQALRENRPIRGVEAWAERPDGSRVPFAAYPTPLRGEAGQVIGGVNVLVDLTDRKAAELALAESEARLRSILETVPDAMLVCDEQGRIESCSATAGTLFGFAPGQCPGKDIAELIPDLRGAPDATAAPGWARSRSLMSPPTIGRRQDGSTFPVEIAIGEVRLESRRLFTCFVRDLTERQATQSRLQDLQAELLHVTRVSAAGEMASALAHELNQPLTAVMTAIGAAETVLEAAGPDTPGVPGGIRGTLELAAKEAMRAGQIVRRLRNFVVRGEADRRVEDLARLIEEASTLTLVGAREKGVQVAFRLEPDLPPVIVDRIQIQQVLHNLMRNAIEALTAGGGDVSRRELVLSASVAGPGTVQVAVADSGPGIAPEVAGRLFEAFVSTKPGGMGVGLSISRSIIEAHGGRLWAEPNAGGGIVFRFTLQAAPSPEVLAS